MENIKDLQIENFKAEVSALKTELALYKELYEIQKQFSYDLDKQMTRILEKNGEEMTRLVRENCRYKYPLK